MNSKKLYEKLLEVGKRYTTNETLIKVIVGAIIGILFSLGFLTSCDNISASQLYTIHSMYHKITDEECIFTVEENTK